MMFGQHDEDEHKNHDENIAPTPDGGLTALPPQDVSIATPPLSNDDDAASDFIMDDAPLSAATPHHVAANVPTAQNADELIDIKQQALRQLSPLLDHLDQTPEEKFRTTMMLIQAADNDTLIKTAYEAAQHITDEKVKAQALLDIVNEINYFTQRVEE